MKLRTLYALVAVLLCIATRARAENVVYTIDPARSFLNVTTRMLIYYVQEQSPGSLLAGVSGLIQADVNPTNVRFLSANIVPATRGSFLPGIDGTGSPAPANYASTVNLGPYGSGITALRSLRFNMNSAVIARSPNFPVNTISLFTTLGWLDLNFTFFGAGRENFSGAVSTNQSAAQGTLVRLGCFETLTLPISTIYPVVYDSEIRFEGELVATRSICGRSPG